MKGVRRVVIVCGLLAVLLVAQAVMPAAAQTASAPICMTFEKTLADPNGIWEGGVNGDLTTVLQSLDISGPIWRVVFLWIVDAGEQSFTATLSGVLNTNTGSVVMKGTVTDGWLLGASVHEAGQAQDPDGIGFTGEICVMPVSAG